MITLADLENDALGTYPQFVATSAPVAELERLGDQIAELSAHLDAATARLLDLIREFDARGGWTNGFRSCADWLTWRIGLDPGAARERVRVARALGTLPRLAQALFARRAVVFEGSRADSGGDPRDRRTTAGRRAGGHGQARGAHRARLASGRPQGRGAPDDTAAREPLATGVSRCRRHGRHPRPARAEGGRRRPEGARGCARHFVSRHRRFRRNAHGRGAAHVGTVARRRPGPDRRDSTESWH